MYSRMIAEILYHHIHGITCMPFITTQTLSALEIGLLLNTPIKRRIPKKTQLREREREKERWGNTNELAFSNSFLASREAFMYVLME